MATATLNLDATIEAIDGMSYTLAGVRGKLRAVQNRFGSLTLEHVATPKGRRSEAYRKMRRMLGDDFTTFFDEIPEEVWAAAEKKGLYRFD